MTRIATAALLLVAATATAQPPQPRRALQIEDFYRIQLTGSPSISPNGRWVLYTVSTRVEDDNSTRVEHWVVMTSGTDTPRRVQHYGKDVANARWTRNSRIAYSAERADWSMDPEQPGRTPVSQPRGTANAVEAADGTIVTLRDRKPQPRPASPAATDFERRHEERFRGVTFDWKDFQRDGQPFPAPDLRIRPAADIVITRPGKDPVVVDAGDVRPSDIAISPDGSRIVFTADPEWRDPVQYDDADLWMIAGGSVTRLTNDGNVHTATAFSPDGKWISFVRDPGTDDIIKERRNHGGPSDVYIMPAAGGAAINLTAHWDLEPENTRWSPDGAHIYFTAMTGGEIHLFRTAVPSGEVTQVTKGPRRLTAITFDGDFTHMAYLVSTHDSQGNVHVARIDGSDERQLTNVNRALFHEVELTTTERLQWASKDGTRIEGWLTYPRGYAGGAPGARFPLVVLSHGGPHAATGYAFDFKKHYFAANGYFVLDTNFRSSTGYGEAFKWATWGAWGDKDGEDVMSGIDYVIARYPVDPARVGHAGHSYGGFMTNWLITQYPDRFAAAISGAGISNWVSDYGTADIYRTKETEFFGTPWETEARDRMIRQSPLTYAGRVKTPTLFVHGEVDQRVPYEEAEQMYFALRRRNVPAKMVQYADQSHGIAGHWNNVHRMINDLRWWNTYLGAKTASTDQGR